MSVLTWSHGLAKPNSLVDQGQRSQLLRSMPRRSGIRLYQSAALVCEHCDGTIQRSLGLGLRSAAFGITQILVEWQSLGRFTPGRF